LKPVSKVKKIRRYLFLKEILFLAVTAFGGPQAHIAMFIKRLIKEKNYLTEEEFLELFSLCNMLPGPTSTQTLTAVGFRCGGPTLAFLTLIVWILPAVTFMSLFVLGISYMDTDAIHNALQFIPAMAVGFIVVAAYQISKKVIRNQLTIIILIASAIVTFYVRTPWIFPIIIIIGGIISYYFSEKFTPNDKPILNVKWDNFILFIGILIASAVAGAITKYKPVLLFENTYRYGSLVFGGGDVLIPMMQQHFVDFKEYLTNEQFFNGFGLVKAMPGPVFSFSAYLGGMTLQDMGTSGQLLGCLLGTIGIFLPGTLLIFFIYPIWNQLKNYPIIHRSLEGINSVSAGLLVGAAFIFIVSVSLSKETGEVFNYTNIIITVLTSALLFMKKIPSPIIVAITIIAGSLL